MNDLFASENLTDKDQVNYFHTIRDKVSENSKVIDQVRNNTAEQVMLGDFPKAVLDAVIENMSAHNEQSTQILASEQKARLFTEMLLAAIKQGL